nr:LRR receptor-like serine/threonine-protein kinase GSO1 [Ipomoea batatas]
MWKFSLWVVILVMLVKSWHSSGCWEEERIALLHVKTEIKYTYGKSLDSWIDDRGSNCCEWPKVTCSNITRRVIELSLGSTRDTRVGYWYIDASIFLPFKHLMSLDLSRNNLGGVIEGGGFDKLSKLSNLEVLDVSFNNLNRSIFSSLSHLSSLKILYLLVNPLDSPLDHLGREKLSGLSNLELLNIRSTDMEDDSILSALNLSDFISLKELDISYNNFQSFGPVYGQGGPKKLENLNLYYNSFGSSIFKSLKWLPSLKILNLGSNNFDGPLHIEDINALNNLEDLDLSENAIERFDTSTSLSGKIRNNSHLQVLHLNTISSNMTSLLQYLVAFPSIKTLELENNNLTSIDTIHALRNLSNLEELFLDDTLLHKDFLQSIGSMSRLIVLSLPRCQLGTTLPNKGWCELKNLQELGFSANQFEGKLPPCLGNLTSLRLVDLSLNKLTGNIASSPLPTLMSLEYLSISSNFFEIPDSFKSFGNHSKLKFLFADGNKAIVETELHGDLVPKFQLHLFTMSNCIGLQKFPRFLHYQHDLRILRLSGNNIEGEVPSWLLQNNTKVQGFYFEGNAFKGILKLSSQRNHDLQTLDVSNNKLSGEIPNNISSTFPNIVALNFSYNLFEGQIPYMGKLNYLTDMDLSNNFLTGEIPKELLIGCPSLASLKLSDNKLEGEIVQEFAYLPSLYLLYLDGNNFTGPIPYSLSNIPLQFLDISDNNFFGKIPRWMGLVTSLEELSLSKNHLEGPIPIEFCNLDSIYLLDLSENNLTGAIPSCLNPSSIKHVLLSKNCLSGQLSPALLNNTSLVVYDLSHNNFVGTIPEWIGSISRLSILLLKGNQFEGMIPVEVCQLIRLSILDLSDNHLSGHIPHCLSEMNLEVTNEKSTASHYTGDNDFALTTYMFNIMDTNSYHVSFGWENGVGLDPSEDDTPTRVEFRTKGNVYYYEGNILNYMSGIDLSNNRFIGEIPLELGSLITIHALNLSHNNLTGTIPETFSMLRNIESLDLSHNKLNGTISDKLLDLTSLEVFSVAYNNLSGAVPEAKAQFATFDKSSYEGNPFLCGTPLEVDCSSPKAPPLLPTLNNDFDQQGAGWMDMEDFYISFSISYLTFLLGLVAVLCINPQWRYSWFYAIEVLFESFLYCLCKN